MVKMIFAMEDVQEALQLFIKNKKLISKDSCLTDFRIRPTIDCVTGVENGHEMVGTLKTVATKKSVKEVELVET